MADPVDSSLPRFRRFDSSSSSSSTTTRNRNSSSKKESSARGSEEDSSTTTSSGSSYVIRSSDLKRFLNHVKQENESLGRQLSSQDQTTAFTQRYTDAHNNTQRHATVSPSPVSKGAPKETAISQSNAHPSKGSSRPEEEEVPRSNGTSSSSGNVDLQKEIEDLQNRYFKQKPNRSSPPSSRGRESPEESNPRVDTGGALGSVQSSLYSVSPVQQQPSSSTSSGSYNSGYSPVEWHKEPQSFSPTPDHELPATELSTIIEQDQESSMRSERSDIRGDNGEVRQSSSRKMSASPGSSRFGPAGSQKRVQASQSPDQKGKLQNKENQKSPNKGGGKFKRSTTTGKGRENVPCRIPIHRQRTAAKRSSQREENKTEMNKVIKNPEELLQDSDSDEYSDDDQLADLPGTNTFVMASNDMSTTSGSVALDGSHHFIPPHDINLQKTIWKSKERQLPSKGNVGESSSSIDWLGDGASLEESIACQSEFVMPPEDSEFAS